MMKTIETDDLFAIKTELHFSTFITTTLHTHYTHKLHFFQIVRFVAFEIDVEYLPNTPNTSQYTL